MFTSKIVRATAHAEYDHVDVPINHLGNTESLIVDGVALHVDVIIHKLDKPKDWHPSRPSVTPMTATMTVVPVKKRLRGDQPLATVDMTLRMVVDAVGDSVIEFDGVPVDEVIRAAKARWRDSHLAQFAP
jgi:hypothetical protein